MNNENRGDLRYTIRVTLEELYSGCSRQLGIQRFFACNQCDGSGLLDGGTEIYGACNVCFGHGLETVIEQTGNKVIQIQRRCRLCSGQGSAITLENRCGVCHGKKLIRERAVHEIRVQKGMSNGQKIKIRGQGSQQVGMEAGDLIITLQEIKHPVFKRDKHNLCMTMHLDLVEALCGFVKVIKSLDNKQLTIRSPMGNVVKDGDVKYLIGKGMPIFGRKSRNGNVVIQFEVKLPKTIPYRLTSTIEKCLNQRRVIHPIPMDAEECNLLDMGTDDHQEQDEYRDPNDQHDEYGQRHEYEEHVAYDGNYYNQQPGDYEAYDDQHGYNQQFHDGQFQDDQFQDDQFQNDQFPDDQFHDQQYNQEGYMHHDGNQPDDNESLESYDATQYVNRVNEHFRE